MRELPEDEAREAYERRGLEPSEDKGEKWFTFEHSPAWRDVERQFMGAVRSHGGWTDCHFEELCLMPDPNELMALLQVYPWHVDTLLQMSEVYRLQSGQSMAPPLPAALTRRHRRGIRLRRASAVRFRPVPDTHLQRYDGYMPPRL